MLHWYKDIHNAKMLNIKKVFKYIVYIFFIENYWELMKIYIENLLGIIENYWELLRKGLLSLFEYCIRNIV